MTRKQRFVDNFWGEDFCSTNGLDVLVKRLKDGRAITKDLEDFLKNRAKIEDEYGRALQRLARQTMAQHEIGTMKSAWETLKNHTEEIGKEHLEVAAHFTERAKELNAFGEMQKNTRKMGEETLRRYCRKKVDLYKQNAQNKKTYDNKCKELETASHNLQVAKVQGSQATMEKTHQQMLNLIKTLSTKEAKAKSDQDRADYTYKETNAVLEQTRTSWESEMAKLCETYENLEVDRFDFLQNEMWAYTNVMSQACVNVDDHCEKIRQSLERCNKDADFDEFISQKGTGKIRPAMIPYTKYGEPEDRHNAVGTLSPMSGRAVPNVPSGRPPVAPPTR